MMSKRNPNQLNDLIHAKVRLGIMSMVMTYDSCDFTFLKKKLQVTDGNLGAHIRRLEKAKYIELEKTFIDRKPKTFVRVTDIGATAYREYISTLEEIINSFTSGEEDD